MAKPESDPSFRSQLNETLPRATADKIAAIRGGIALPDEIWSYYLNNVYTQRVSASSGEIWLPNYSGSASLLLRLAENHLEEVHLVMGNSARGFNTAWYSFSQDHPDSSFIPYIQELRLRQSEAALPIGFTYRQTGESTAAITYAEDLRPSLFPTPFFSVQK